MEKYNNKPYVYKLTNKDTGQFYIGYRFANKLPASQDFGIEYRSSSKAIIKEQFNQYNQEIIVEFYSEDREEASISAYWYEQGLIKQYFKDPLCLNENYQDKETSKGIFRRTGLITEAHRTNMSTAQRNKKPASNIARKRMSEFQKGRLKTEEHRAKISEANRGKIPSQKTIDKMKATKAIMSEERKREISNRIRLSRIGRKQSQEQIDNRVGGMKGSRWMTSPEQKTKFILKNDVDALLEAGWVLGRKSMKDWAGIARQGKMIKDVTENFNEKVGIEVS